MKIHYLKLALGFLIVTIVVAFFTPMAIELKVGVVPFGIFVWTFIVVAALVPFSALPLYLIITNWLGLNYKSVLIAAITSTVTVSIFFVFPFSFERSVVNGVVFAENGIVTLAGYIHGFVRLLAMSLVGFIAGNVFYYFASIGKVKLTN